jgi:sirohydrochlorin cobaltochelatase
MQTAILIIGHGTREPEGTRGFLELVSSVQKQVRSHVQPAFLEISRPSIPQGADYCLSTGAKRLLVIPFFLFGGRDVKKKLPQALEEVRAGHPQVAVILTPHIGQDHPILEILKERLQSAKGSCSLEDTAVLLAARGSSDQAALAEMQQVRARFAQEAGLKRVQHAFVEVASPSTEDGIQACLDLHPKQIIVLPYLLLPGLMLKKIKDRVEAVRPQPAGPTSIRVADCLWPHPKLTELLIERIQKGL